MATPGALEVFGELGGARGTGGTVEARQQVAIEVAGQVQSPLMNRRARSRFSKVQVMPYWLTALLSA